MRKWIAPAAVIAAWAFSLWAFPHLPDRVPVHWGMDGRIDRYGSRAEGALLLPAIATVLWLAMIGLPRIDPRRANYAKFRPTYDLVVAAILLMMVAVDVAVIGTALGWPVPVDRVGPASVGVLFIVLGNVMPRSRSNWWFGIRTPWTLSSDTVWAQTHRVGGYLFVVTGVLLLGASLISGRWLGPVAVTGAVGTGVACTVYSYILWRREQSA